MTDDRAIEEIREIRRAISKQCNDDPRQLADFYRREQTRYCDRFWKPVMQTSEESSRPVARR